MNRDSNPTDGENPAGDPADDPVVAGPPTDAQLRRSYRLPEDDDRLLAECRVTMFKAPGPGGQHKNTTMSAVRLVHEPSGLILIGRRERSQRRNLMDALARLREKLRIKLTPPKKRRKTRPSRASKEKRLDAKKKRSGVKRLRAQRPSDD